MLVTQITLKKGLDFTIKEKEQKAQEVEHGSLSLKKRLKINL